MFECSDESVFVAFEQGELEAPTPRKELDGGRCIYVSRELTMSKKLGAPVLCDFGSAVIGGVQHLEDVQPNIYRAPEVILEVPWTYSIDIWDIFEGQSLFTGKDPEFHTYRGRAHLAEMIRLLSPPPSNLVAHGQLSHRFFDPQGNFSFPHIIPEKTTFERRETTLSGQDKAAFLCFVRRMLQWEAGKRSSAKSLADDEWIRKQITF